MTEKVIGRIHGKCVDCGGPTQLLEWDLKKGTRTLQCQKCGLLHHYRKDVFGWKLTKADKGGG